MLALQSDSADEHKTISEEIVAFHKSLVQQGVAHDINPSLSLVEQLRQLNGAALSALKRGEQRPIAPDMQQDDWQFRQLAETLPQLIWITLPDGYHIYFNQRWYEYTGVNIGDTDGAFWANLLHPDDYVRTLDVWHQCLKTGERYSIEYRFRNRNGDYRWFLGRAMPARNEKGEIIRWFGTCTDVHEQKLTADELKESQGRLRQSEERLRLAQQVARIGTFERNLKTNASVWSPELDALHGLPDGGFGGTFENWLSLVHPDDRESAAKAAAQAVKTGTLEAEWRIIMPDETVRWISGRGQIFHDETGQPHRLVGANLDITRLKAAEEELRKSNEFADRIMASSLSGLYIFDRKNGKFSFINQKYVLLTGYTPDELLLLTRQNSAIDLFHPDDREKVLAHIESMQSIQSHETREIEYRFKRKDGQWRWFLSREALFSSHPDGSVAEYIGSFIDITERKQAEEDLAASRARLAELSAQLIQAQEQERQKLAWELHDELGQRFTSLQLTLHHLKSLVADKKNEGSWTDAISEVNTLIQRVRDISHSLRPPLLDYLGLEATVSNLLEQHFAHSGIQFSLEYVGLPEKLPASVEITGYRIIQEGITNISRHANATKVSIEMNGDKEGKEIEIVIRDNGAGFDSALIGIGGRPSGIGLNGMRERVGLMGGTFHLMSEPGHGTMIEVLLPLEPS